MEAFRQAREKALEGGKAPSGPAPVRTVRTGGPAAPSGPKEPDPKEIVMAYEAASGEILLITEEQKAAMVDYQIMIEGQAVTVLELSRQEYKDFAEIKANAHMEELKSENKPNGWVQLSSKR